MLSLSFEQCRAAFARGAEFYEARRFDDALICYRTVATASPHYRAKALSNCGLVHHQLHEFDKEQRCYDAAAELAVPGELAELYYNRATLRLTLGDFEKGFKDYEWRLHRASRQKREFKTPRWEGESGRAVLIWAEQGFGDTIQFCRYLAWVAARAKDVIFEVQSELVDLMCSLLPDNIGVIAKGETLPDHDCNYPLLSLPLLAGTTLQSVPADVPYLFASPEKVAEWRLPAGAFQVGVTWSSNPCHGVKHLQWVHRLKTMGCDLLAPLIETGCEFHSLQKGPPSSLPGIAEHDIKDFSDVAGIIANLDLVISIDTAAAHLAGAMGRPVWLLCPYNACWRWLLETPTSHWYPSMRIFRQRRANEWAPLIEEVRVQLLERKDTWHVASSQ